MQSPNPSEMHVNPPSDDRLIDYLLGESVDDEAIELWLAADLSHVERLERLAETVCVAATLASQETTVVNGWSLKHALASLAALAASVALAVIGWRFYQVNQTNWNDDRLAIAWAETVSNQESTDSIALNWPDPFLFEDSEGLDVQAKDPWLGDLASDEPVEMASGEVSNGEFAAGDDSPPHWLLVAISQMPTESPLDAGDDASEANDAELLQ